MSEQNSRLDPDAEPSTPYIYVQSGVSAMDFRSRESQKLRPTLQGELRQSYKAGRPGRKVDIVERISPVHDLAESSATQLLASPLKLDALHDYNHNELSLKGINIK